MIEEYKILHGVYDELVTNELFNVTDQTRTRGHSWLRIDADWKYARILHFKSSKCLEFING